MSLFMQAPRAVQNGITSFFAENGWADKGQSSPSCTAFRRQKKKNYSTWTSRVLPDRTTIQASTCLTSQIGRDAVLSRVWS